MSDEILSEQEWRERHSADAEHWSEWADRFPHGMVPSAAFVTLRADRDRLAARVTDLEAFVRDQEINNLRAEVDRLRAALQEALETIGEMAEGAVADRREHLRLVEQTKQERAALMAEIQRCIETAPNADARTAYEWIAEFFGRLEPCPACWERGLRVCACPASAPQREPEPRGPLTDPWRKKARCGS